MSYRPSATQPRGTWGRFLDQMRRERGWSQQQAFEALREGLHLGPKSRASYVAIEAGRTPRPDEQDFLIRYFGRRPDAAPEPVEATQTPDALVRALYAQTEAINALVAELRDERLSEDREARLRVIEALVLPRGRRGAEVSRERSAPRASVG